MRQIFCLERKITSYNTKFRFPIIKILIETYILSEKINMSNKKAKYLSYLLIFLF